MQVELAKRATMSGVKHRQAVSVHVSAAPANRTAYFLFKEHGHRPRSTSQCGLPLAASFTVTAALPKPANQAISRHRAFTEHQASMGRCSHLLLWLRRAASAECAPVLHISQLCGYAPAFQQAKLRIVLRRLACWLQCCTMPWVWQPAAAFYATPGLSSVLRKGPGAATAHATAVKNHPRVSGEGSVCGM